MITDVCLCEYTDHGHCGLLNVACSAHHANLPGLCAQRRTLEILARLRCRTPEPADIVPSGMMDGMVAAIRGVGRGDFACAHHDLCRQVRIILLRLRGGGGAAPATANPPDGPGQHTRGAARSGSMWQRGPIS